MSEQKPYIIDLKRFPIGTHQFDIQLDDAFFASVEKSEILSGKVDAHVTLNLREEDYTLMIAVKGTVVVTCDRCLDPMNIDIDDEQDNVQSDDVQCTKENELDLSWLAYEITCINIPIVHSHQTGECNPQMELLLHDHLCDEPDPDEIIDN